MVGGLGPGPPRPPPLKSGPGQETDGARMIVICIHENTIINGIVYYSSPRLARSLLFYGVDSVCLSVCPFVCHAAPSNRFFFFVYRWNRAIFGRHLSMWHSRKRCSLIFDLGPLTPKIYSPKLLAITLHYHVATRGRALGAADLPAESRQSTKLRADPCCQGNEIWARREDLVAYRLVKYTCVCDIDE